MSRSRMAFIGIIVLAIAVIVIAQLATGGGDDGDNNGDGEGNNLPLVEVSGFTGSEKTDFLSNPEVQRILRERYNITVDYTSKGSVAQVTEPSTGMDFLWPSNDMARVLFEELNPQLSFKSSNIFRSPMVLYSWSHIAGYLLDAGLVEERDDIYYANMETLVTMAVAGDTTWADLGYTENPNRFKIISTDPTESNSGNMFYGLMANLLVKQDTGSEVADDATIDTVLPVIEAYYDGMGLMKDGSGDLFEAFVATGNGSYPLIINYESLLIEFTLQNPDYRQEILSKIRVIYPEPTMWSDHPLIALTDDGQRLLEALEDEELQRIAWEQHGFRSGLGVISGDSANLEGVKLPDRIGVATQLPRPSVMLKLIETLAQ